jgi:hypothetical protein
MSEVLGRMLKELKGAILTTEMWKSVGPESKKAHQERG